MVDRYKEIPMKRKNPSCASACVTLRGRNAHASGISVIGDLINDVIAGVYPEATPIVVTTECDGPDDGPVLQRAFNGIGTTGDLTHGPADDVTPLVVPPHPRRCATISAWRIPFSANT